jgi:hypothetical protein
VQIRKENPLVLFRMLPVLWWDLNSRTRRIRQDVKYNGCSP